MGDATPCLPGPGQGRACGRPFRRSARLLLATSRYPQPAPTLLMPPLSMLALRCRPVGQTPIYEQLRGELINADVPPSPGDQHVHSGRHRLDEQRPGAVAVVGRPSGPEAGGVTGHHRRMGTSPGARLAGDQQEAGRAWGPRAAVPWEAPAQAAPRDAGQLSAGPAGDPSAGAVGGHALGHQAVGAARAEQRTEPGPAAARRVVFSWFVP